MRRASAASGDSAGMTNAKRAFRSGLVMRACCSARIASAPAHVTQRQFLRHLDEIVFRKRQPRDLLLPPPHAIEIGDALWRGDRPPECGEVRRLQRGRRRLRDTGAQRLLEAAGNRRALGVREIAPERVVRVARGSARRSTLRGSCGSVRSARSNSCRGSVFPSSMSSHNVTQAMPRVRPSPISLR